MKSYIIVVLTVLVPAFIDFWADGQRWPSTLNIFLVWRSRFHQIYCPNGVRDAKTHPLQQLRDGFHDFCFKIIIFHLFRFFWNLKKLVDFERWPANVENPLISKKWKKFKFCFQKMGEIIFSLWKLPELDFGIFHDFLRLYFMLKPCRKNSRSSVFVKFGYFKNGCKIVVTNGD